MNRILAGAAGAVMALGAAAAQAAVLIEIDFVGGDVVVSANGTLDLAGFTAAATLDPTFEGGLDASTGEVSIYPAGSVTAYVDTDLASGSLVFGAGGGDTSGILATGDSFAIASNANGVAVLLDPGYDFTDPARNTISGSTVFQNTTFGRLGIARGIDTTLTLDNGDSVRLTTALAPVPLPAGLPLAAIGLGALALLRRRA